MTQLDPAVPPNQHETVETRIAGISDMDEVWRLTYGVYLRSGYIKPNREQMISHFPHLDLIPQTTVLIAEEAGKVVGTNSLTVDGMCGLHVDEDFPDESNKVRLACADREQRLGASWRIVTSDECRSSLKVVVSLITATMVEVEKQGIGCLLFDFNPRHGPFYTRLLGLETIATGQCGSLGAPAILMIGYWNEMAKKWKHFCDKRKVEYSPNLGGQ